MRVAPLAAPVEQGPISGATSARGTAFAFESGEHTRAKPHSDVPDPSFDELPESDRYDFSAVLGEGGMGEVRLCVDRRVRRPVAMKLIRPERAALKQDRAQFVREVLAQAQLEHPAIVPVYDMGTDETGSLYFTMRRVQGLTLEQIIKGLRNDGDAAPPDHSQHRLLVAFESVCLAVHYAHMRAVFHCDIKPANIMLGSFGEVYVLDWGIAAHADPDRDVSSNSGGGTPGYMAPEQIRQQPIDARTDVYGLGATLFELLTHRPLHRGTRAQLLERTLVGKPVRPSAAAPDLDIAPELDAICMKATACDPSERYATVKELHDALDAYMAGDRDLALRRAMSEKHATIAQAFRERAQKGGEGAIEARSQALSSVGRALAFDPENAAALRTLVSLMTEGPKEMPKDARAEMHGAERSFQRTRAVAGALGFFAWVLLLPVFYLAGIGTLEALLANAFTWSAAGCVLVAVAIKPRPDGYSHVVEPILGALAVSMTTLVFHSLALTATFATVLAMGFTLAMRRNRRFVPFVATSLSVLAPWLLATFHIIRPEIVFGASKIGAGLHLQLLSALVCIFVAAFFGMRRREKLNEVQEKTYTSAWQLRQLLPKRATDTVR